MKELQAIEHLINKARLNPNFNLNEIYSAMNSLIDIQKKIVELENIKSADK